MGLALSDDLERLALEWYRARRAFLEGATVLDATTKLARLEKPELLDACARAEHALADECRLVLKIMGK